MLSVLFNVQTGALRMHFDEEGRDELLNSLKWSVQKLDHELLFPDKDMETELPIPSEWQPRDFVKIECHPNADEPLCVTDGIVITGGARALSALAEQLQVHTCCVSIG